MTDLILRPAINADAAALSRLGTDSFVAKFGYLYTKRDLATFLEDAHSPASVERQIADPHLAICLAQRGGELVGYCTLSFRSGFPEHAQGRRPVELKRLYTAPGETGGGIGAELMAWALATARQHGADEMQLSVWNANEGAQRFYARHGFAKVADVTFRVGEQLDEEFLFSLML